MITPDKPIHKLLFDMNRIRMLQAFAADRERESYRRSPYDQAMKDVGEMDNGWLHRWAP